MSLSWKSRHLVRCLTLFFALLGFTAGAEAQQKFLVVASQGPGFASPEEAVQILEGVIIPSFDAVMKLEEEGKILAGGVPVGERSLLFIIEAKSHDELDRLIRDMPAWPLLEWEVTPLQSISGRADHERAAVEKLKGSND